MLFKDSSGNPINSGDHVTVTVPAWDGSPLTIISGTLEFVGSDISSWGCGYAIRDPRHGITFLSSISKGRTTLLVGGPQ